MRRYALAALAATLIAAIAGCKDDPAPTEIDVELLASTSHLDRINLQVRDESVDADGNYVWATLDITDIADRDLTTTPALLRLKETAALKDKPFLLLARGYVTDLATGVERVVVTGAIVLQYVAHTRQTKRLRLTSEFLSIDKDGDGFGVCGSYIAPTDPIEQGVLDEARNCDCNDVNDRINPFVVETCADNIDNNCTGWPYDENCEDCVSDQPCTDLAPERWDSVGIGQCKAGVRRCVDTVVDGATVRRLNDTCENSGAPVTEIDDDGIDNDCDGTVDEGSACPEGTTSRPCLLGFVNEEATALAKGICVTGTQACVDDVWSNQCVGETRPQRPPRDTDEQSGVDPENWTGIGFFELAISGIVDQCDGADNDCDGFYDEEVTFDNDRDGYTYCGTNDAPPADGTNHTVSGTSYVYRDCNDSNDAIHPGAVERCDDGDVDNDCSCDHGSAVSGGSDSGVVSGVDCSAPDTYLDCSRTTDRVGNPSGTCDEIADGIFYSGYGNSSGADRLYGCFPCRAAFGETCGADGVSCASKSEACCVAGACPSSSHADSAGDLSRADVSLRPYCAVPVDGTCVCGVPPSWTAVVAGTEPSKDGTRLDERDDCGTILCDGKYKEIIDEQCYYWADIDASAANCNGRPLCTYDSGGAIIGDPGLCCDGRNNNGCCQGNEICTTQPASARGDLWPRPACRLVNGGCTGDTAPTTLNANNGTDKFNDCRSSFECAKYYVKDGTGLCHTRAAVDATAHVCNGEGSCRTEAESCEASGQGGIVAGRPTCQQVTTSTCTGTTGPLYVPISMNQDPYDDCSGTDLCDGAGNCKKNLASACTSGTQCLSGFCSEEGVCCNSACTGACNNCSSGTCTVRQANDNVECTACQRCNGSQTTCELQTGASGANCNTGQTFCCNGACVAPGVEYGGACGSGDCTGTWGCNTTIARCSSSTRDCASCNEDTRTSGTCSNNGSCTGTTTEECPACQSCMDSGATTSCVAVGGENSYGDGSTDTSGNLCETPRTCNGLGQCGRLLGESCSDNDECTSGFCADGVCCNTACTGDCLSCSISGSTGTCTAVNLDDDVDTCSGESWCCAGTCVNPSSSTNGVDGACGSGDCGGSWSCNGAAANCSSAGTQCGSCSGDTRVDGTCNASGTCADTENITCAVCTHCDDNGDTTACTNAAAYAFDDTSPNTCNSNQTRACDGAGACEYQGGASCEGNAGNCVSANCSSGPGGTCKNPQDAWCDSNGDCQSNNCNASSGVCQ